MALLRDRARWSPGPHRRRSIHEKDALMPGAQCLVRAAPFGRRAAPSDMAGINRARHRWRSHQAGRSAATPSLSAASRRRPSRVHSRPAELRRTAARRWTSTRLKPLPCRACNSTNESTSVWVATGAPGRSDNNPRTVLRSRREPSANSPMIMGWIQTCASFRSVDRAVSERGRCDPDRGVDQDHVERRRGGDVASGSLPPSAASRRELSWVIRASRPRRTKVAFSVRPVSSDARRTSSSSKFNVVRMHNSMHQMMTFRVP